MKGNGIARIVVKFLFPFILLFALYVQFHGDYGPGGGFQAGVIFAAALIVYALIYGLDRVRELVSPRLAEILAATGTLVYGGTGVVSMLLGASYLDYSVLAHDPAHGQHYGILLVELGVGITVAAAMLVLFYAFAGRTQLRAGEVAELAGKGDA